jgi:hypothetical protein
LRKILKDIIFLAWREHFFTFFIFHLFSELQNVWKNIYLIWIDRDFQEKFYNFCSEKLKCHLFQNREKCFSWWLFLWSILGGKLRRDSQDNFWKFYVWNADFLHDAFYDLHFVTYLINCFNGNQKIFAFFWDANVCHVLSSFILSFGVIRYRLNVSELVTV